MRRASITAGWLLPLLGAALAAQGDERDRVTLANGRELRGRVFSRADADAIVWQDGTRRERIEKSEIVAMDVVRDRVREFFVLHDRLPDNVRHLWYLVGWASSRQLDDLARLLATHLVLREPEHEDARRFLGHRRRGRDWLWPDDGEWHTLGELEKHHADWGHPWVVAGEHFTLRTNAGLRAAVDAVWDLERFVVQWYERFAAPLALYEFVGAKMQVEIWRDRESFPRLNKLEHPYIEHRVENGAAARGLTYFGPSLEERPVRLFEVATQLLLYRTLADDPATPTKHRYCAWAEVGLARYLERSTTGPPGRAVARPWRVPLDEAALVAAAPGTSLVNVTHRSTRQLTFVVTDEIATDWAIVHTFVAFLLETPSPAGLRQGFLDYLGAGVRLAKGDSSSGLDKALGAKVEQLEPLYREWLAARVRITNNQPAGH